MYWIQLTRTNAVFSRIALVSRFYAENQLSGKSVENMEKSIFNRGTHGAKRPSGGGPRGAHTTRWRGWAQAAPPHGVATSATPPTPLRDYKTPFDLKTEGGFDHCSENTPERRRHRKPYFGTRNSVLAPCRDGELEEIIAIIATDASPSTIHVSPIHV